MVDGAGVVTGQTLPVLVRPERCMDTPWHWHPVELGAQTFERLGLADGYGDFDT